MVADIGISPEEEVTDSQGGDIFAVGKHDRLEDAVSFSTGVRCNHRHSHLLRIRRSSLVCFSGRHRERFCFQVCVLLS